MNVADANADRESKAAGTASGQKPRIMLIHALSDSLAPIHSALRSFWPEAEYHDLLDTSLSADLAAQNGVLDDSMVGRFRTLGRYAASAGPAGRGADGILFTCSAFGPAIEATRKGMTIPVLKPNESAFGEAILRGGRMVLLVTFPPALNAMLTELEAMRDEAGVDIGVEGRLVEGALGALRRNRPDEHDALIATAASRLRDADTIVLGQFSMARAAPAVRLQTSAAVLPTPEAAVRAMKALVEARR